jgi:hypothetical protein
MNIWCSQDEISVKLLAAAATDEVLVEAAKVGDRPAFRGAVGGTFEHSAQGGLADVSWIEPSYWEGRPVVNLLRKQGIGCGN